MRPLVPTKRSDVSLEPCVQAHAGPQGFLILFLAVTNTQVSGCCRIFGRSRLPVSPPRNERRALAKQ